jgi:murein DD-endopeptidase MepM/ murein hydrolase activator NlpD
MTFGQYAPFFRLRYSFPSEDWAIFVILGRLLTILLGNPMVLNERRVRIALPVVTAMALCFASFACSRSDQEGNNTALAEKPPSDITTQVPSATPTRTTNPPTTTPTETATPRTPRFSPTPDQARELPKIRDYYETHVVRYGETLNSIAYKYGVGVQQIQLENNIFDPNVLSVGIVLSIPPPIPQPPGPGSKLIPDSEVVFGPATTDLERIYSSIDENSYLRFYVEIVDGFLLDGPAIVQKVAESYSINPRILIAVLHQQSGWVEGDVSDAVVTDYPIGWYQQGREGLFSQLSWAANELNRAFYRWKSGWAGPYIFYDGRVVPPGIGVNAGTVAIQHLFSLLYSLDTWRDVVGDYGFAITYKSLFGDPFDFSVEPLLHEDLVQPDLELPFEINRTWSFTGGPHSAFGNSAAWAALDFAPPGNGVGCMTSNEWVVAAADGVITRSDSGQVSQDLSGDGFEQTGWSLIYLHIETRDRVEAGIYLRAGDRIGHPSCEGGVSTGTHVHIARKYNGVWIEAGGVIPFNLGGWIAASAGTSYNGSLTLGGDTLLACACRASYNQISP